MTINGLKKLIRHPKIFWRDYKKKIVKTKIVKTKIVKTKIVKTIDINSVNILTPFTHILYSGEGENGINHLNLWIPIF